MDMDRSERVEQEFRKEFKEIRDVLSDIKKSLAVLKAKQSIGVWIINTLITVALTVMTITVGGNFFSK